MEHLGFIHDMMDVKVLILFVMSRVIYPVDEQKIYELCYQDDRVSYFDVLQAIPELVASGHLAHESEGYVITPKGKEACEQTEDSVAWSVRQRANRAVERFNRQTRRDSFVRTEIIEQPSGDFLAVMSLDDELGRLMTLELTAPSARQARQFTKAFHGCADRLFCAITEQLNKNDQESGG